MTEGPKTSRASAGPGSSGGPEDEPPPDSRVDHALLGRTISGKYKIEKFLGGGAMGAVYRAHFAALEKNVAVKVMHRAVAVDPNFVGRFHREAKAASRLDHPNSMRVIDFGEEPDGLLYIAMEYVEGRDLYRVIHDDWPISNADIGDILMQALAAIAVAHEMGVIHRDLKPENLMILRAKNDEEKDAYLVKVCDFGIAKITEKDEDPKSAVPGSGPVGGQKLTTQGLVVGTPEYMSPEQAKGEKLDPRSDIYSMGVILYQLLTGRTPFSGDTPLAVVLKHITEQPPAPSVHYAGVHKGLEAISLKALAKDRNERFQTARAMRNAIREALDGRPLPAGRVTESDAVTDLAVGAQSGIAPGTGPMAIIGPPAMTSPSGPLSATAPTISAGMFGSHLTPLGTAAATGSNLAPPPRSRTGLVVPTAARVATVALLVAVGGAGAYIMRDAGAKGGDRADPAPRATSTNVTSTSAPTSDPTARAATPNATQAPIVAESVTAPVDPKHPKQPAPPAHAANANTGNAITANTNAGTAKTAEPASTANPPPTQEPPPPPVTAAPPPPPVTAAPPPPPSFNPATCKAMVGPARSNGATTARSLQMNGTPGAWTACAQRSLRDRPGGPIAATVHIMFTDNKNFRGASCAACPAPLAQCIATSTQRTVTIDFKGEVTGEPAFDVPVTFTCE